MFVSNKLIFVDGNVEFQEENIIILNDEVNQEIASKETIAATYALLKESNMAGFCRIEDSYEFVSSCNSTWPRK